LPLAALPLLLVFAVTLFLSAALLFLVQPMVGKMLLPLLGGTPAVWNTCMVFFQALLLAGYAYAHATTAWLGVRRQALLHLAVLLLPFASLSLVVDPALLDYGDRSPVVGLLLGLLLTVGLPFFVVSTSAPLLQKWFADTGHPAAQDPYFLYGASNLGSMLALLGYPTVVEPWLALADQRLVWRIGYAGLVGLTALCAVCLWRSRGVVSGKKEIQSPLLPDDAPLTTRHSPLTAARWLRWVALAFVPSSLMLGVTTYLTTDIAAIPLLWVLPLGLYLLTFILVFSRLPAAVHRLMVALLPFLILPLVFLMLSEYPLPIGGKIVVHLAVLFVAAMVCHGELARDRPPTRYLTGYYLAMSVGGVLGGLFNALAAPVLFNGIVEYPLALVLACLLTPAPNGKPRAGLAGATGVIGFYLGAGVALLVPALGRSDLSLARLAGGDGFWLAAGLLAAPLVVWLSARGDRDERGANWLDLALPAALGVLAVGLDLGLRIIPVHRGLDRLFARLHDALPAGLPPRVVGFLDPSSSGPLVLLVCGLPVVLCALFLDRPRRFGLGVAALLLASSFCELLDDDVVLRGRSFFGVLRVADDGNFRRLEHGTTLHGMQRRHWDRSTFAAVAVVPLAAPHPFGEAALLAAGQDTWHHPGREPLTYFHRTGPIGQVFAAYPDRLAGRHLGLIGLGSGTLACYGQPGQRLTYYEIDPLVQRVAYNPECFTFLSDAQARGVAVDVVLGDARLKLAERARRGTEEKFALLVVDAFSSDAIPVHLITRQARTVYLDNLADDGLLVFHISNRYLDLEPVLANLAADAGLAGLIEADDANGLASKASSTWVVLARQEGTLERLAQDGRWRALKVRPDVGVWTDDYSNLLRVFDWRH
jgi:hypothetical protein